MKSGLTKRALDGGDSSPFLSIFHASSSSCSQTLSSPAPPPVTQTIINRIFQSQTVLDVLIPAHYVVPGTQHPPGQPALGDALLGEEGLFTGESRAVDETMKNNGRLETRWAIAGP